MISDAKILLIHSKDIAEIGYACKKVRMQVKMKTVLLPKTPVMTSASNYGKLSDSVEDNEESYM